jgi:hypothetical protein
VRALVACAVFTLGLLWLWHEVQAPPTLASSPGPTAHEIAGRVTAPGRVAPVRPAAALASPAAASEEAPAPPPGGVRTWSPSAAPVDGPDPFAPVPQVRTLDETRAGLTD